MIKYAPKGHSQLAKLKSALEKVSESAYRVNASMTDRQNRIRIFDIQNQFSPPQLLMKPHRRFIKEGVLGKLNRRRKVKKYIFFLFSDIIVYGERHKGGAGRPSYLEFHRKIHFRGAKLYDIDPKKKFPHRFEVRGKEKSIVCVAGSRQEALDWVDIVSQLSRERAARRQTRTFGLNRIGSLISSSAPMATPDSTPESIKRISTGRSDGSSPAERIMSSNMKAARILGIAPSSAGRRASSVKHLSEFRFPACKLIIRRFV